MDDGSRDNTDDVVKDLMRRISCLRLLVLYENCGKGGAVKQGVLHSRGRYILMVNHYLDDESNESLVKRKN